MRTHQIELLQRMPIFGAIRRDALELLLDDARRREVAAGGYFFRENDEADSMWVLVNGTVVISKSWQGNELLLRRLQGGDCFGEMALLDLFPRSASARADQPCTAIEITPAQLHRLSEHDMEQFALIQMNIGREMSRRLRDADELLFRARMGETLSGLERLLFDHAVAGGNDAPSKPSTAGEADR